MKPLYSLMAAATAVFSLMMPGAWAQTQAAQGGNTATASGNGGSAPQMDTQAISGVLNFIQHVNQSEVQLATDAQGKIQSAQLKTANQKIIQEAQNSVQKVQSAAGDLGATINGFQEGESEKALTQIMGMLNGPQYDKAYVIAQKAGLSEATDALQQIQNQVEGQQLEQIVNDTLSQLRQHAQELANAPTG